MKILFEKVAIVIIVSKDCFSIYSSVIDMVSHTCVKWFDVLFHNMNVVNKMENGARETLAGFNHRNLY